MQLIKVFSKKSGSALIGLLLFLFTLLPSCTRTNTKAPSLIINDKPQTFATISNTLLHKAQLERDWAYKLPILGGEEVERIFLYQKVLYILLTNNTLFSVNPKTGSFNWTNDIAQDHQKASQGYYYKNTLNFIFGRSFVQISTITGEILASSFELNFKVSTPPAVTENTLFVGSTDRKMYALRLNDPKDNGLTKWWNVCRDVPVGTVSATEDEVYFTTRNNTLYASKTQKRSLLFSKQTFSPLCGVTVVDGQCFMPGESSILYCFDAISGEKQWLYRCGEILKTQPIVIKSEVYQEVAHNSLLCLNKLNGEKIWELKKGKALLSLTEKSAYAITLDKNITKLNRKTGVNEITFFIDNIDFYTTNTQTSSIFLASTNGQLIALSPIEN